MTKTIKTAGVIVLQENKVLLVRHGEAAEHLNNVYGIPAGRMEKGESSVETAVRELNEETGLITDVNNLQIIPEIYNATIQRKNGINTFNQETFLCNHWEGKLKATEETIPEWVCIQNLDGIQLLLNMKKMIFDGIKLKQNNV